ncbi:MAG: hypothetical protein O7H41_19675 [Planctomycetota bacterium]|nr:hypothetical protein [Planctomycetota bacterium]
MNVDELRCPKWPDCPSCQLYENEAFCLAMGRAVIALGHLQFVLMVGVQRLIEWPDRGDPEIQTRAAASITSGRPLGSTISLFRELLEIKFQNLFEQPETESLLQELSQTTRERNWFLHSTFAADEDGAKLGLLRDITQSRTVTPGSLHEFSVQTSRLARRLDNLVDGAMPDSDQD